MFDIGFSEILLIAIAALIAIGPKDLPDILFRLGRFSRQIKIFMNGVRNQYADIMHEAEVTHYRKELESIVRDDAPKAPLMLPLPPSETKQAESEKDGSGGA